MYNRWRTRRIHHRERNCFKFSRMKENKPPKKRGTISTVIEDANFLSISATRPCPRTSPHVYFINSFRLDCFMGFRHRKTRVKKLHNYNINWLLPPPLAWPFGMGDFCNLDYSLPFPGLPESSWQNISRILNTYWIKSKKIHFFTQIEINDHHLVCVCVRRYSCSEMTVKKNIVTVEKKLNWWNLRKSHSGYDTTYQRK